MVSDGRYFLQGFCSWLVGPPGVSPWKDVTFFCTTRGACGAQIELVAVLHPCNVRAACPSLKHLKVFEGKGESAHPPRGTSFARVWQAPIGQEGVSQGQQQAKHVVNTLKFRRSAFGSPKFVAEVSETSHNFVCCLYGDASPELCLSTEMKNPFQTQPQIPKGWALLVKR